MTKPFKIIEQALIDGRWQHALSNRTVDVTNPATQAHIGTIPLMGAAETTTAIDAAYRAFGTWSKLTALERANYLLTWHDLINKNLESLAYLLSLEQGKSLQEARGEISYGASFVRWFAEEARRINGDIIPTQTTTQRQLVFKQAVGVVGAITPWNFPNAMITRKIAPALAAGCTIVLKPSELTPFSAFALGELALQAGIPAGVINIITGDADAIGKTLCNDDRVRKVSFTGSTRVGQLLAAQAATTVKKLSLELGGNAPFIIFDDADLNKAIPHVIASKFRNNGQTCVCANRILVHERIYDAFLEQFKTAVANLKVGLTYQDDTCDLGPLINNAAVNKVERLVKDAIAKGATCVLGGKSLALGNHFYEPTILANMQEQMDMANEEIFGPVAAVYKFTHEEEAIKIANNTTAGLASYVFTQDLSRFWRVSEALEYGIVSVNTGLFSNAAAPFGGVKYSGYGREGSQYGIDEYIYVKYVCIDIS